MKNHLDKLPPAMVYSEYLKKVISEFQISENEARQKFGSFTLKQWSELFYNLKKEKAVSLFKFQDSSQSLERPAGENYWSK